MAAVNQGKKRKMEAGEESKVDESFFRLLCTTKAQNFAIGGKPADTPIFVCSRKDSIVKVWKALIEKNFLAVPVLLDSGKYFGFLTVVDIVRYIISHFEGAKLVGADNYWKLIEEEKSFQHKTVNDLLVWPLSRKNPFHPVSKDYSAFTVVEALARETGLHRVPIIDPESREILNLVTQSQVISYLHKNADILGPKKNKKIGDCPRFKKDVMSINKNATAMDAFAMMIDHQVTGIPVVDDDGKLTAYLSVRDMKTISYDAQMFTRLQQKIVNFIRKLRNEFQEKNGRPRSMLTCVAGDTLATVIAQCAEHKVHRLCIVDAKRTKQLTGILTLQDILAELLD